MASTYTPLGVELQATGENAGTWGTKTNTNLQIFEQIVGGFTAQSIAGGAQNTDLSVSDGSTGATLSHRMIEFTGSITGNQVVRIPIDVQTFYYLRNSTSGAYTVQFKYITGSGDSFTFSATDKGDTVVFATANDGTNPDIYSLPAGNVTTAGTQTLTNKTLTSPKINENVAVTSTATELNLLDGASGLVQADFTKLAAVTSDATELNALDGITAVVGELNALDLGSTAVGTAIASKAVILDSNKDYTGFRNITLSGELDAATGDFSGAVDVAGATTTAAITASGIIKTDDTTDATSTTDGSLQTDGGLSVAKDAVIGDDLFLLSDSSVIHFGADSEITLTHTNNTGLTLNSGTGSNTFQIQNTDGGADDGPIMKLYRNSSSPADADNVGEIRFIFNNDASEITEAAVIATKLSDVSNGTEDSTLTIRSMVAGNITSRIEMNASDTVINEDSKDLDFRIETNAEVNAFKIDGGAETAAFSVPVTFNDAANVAQAALTSSSNAVAWDATDKPNAFHLTTENTTFSAPSNAVEGAFICLEINYNGSHTIAFNTVFEFAASTAPTTTDTDGKTDILVFRYNGAVWQEVGRTLNLSES